MNNLVSLMVMYLKDSTGRADRCPIGVLGWCLLMGQFRSLHKVMVPYGLDPTPNKDGLDTSTCKQFMTLYNDMNKRERTKKFSSADIISLFKLVQSNIRYTVSKEEEDKETKSYDAKKQ